MSLISEAKANLSALLQGEGVPRREAKKTAKMIAEDAEEFRAKEGTASIPANAADLVLSGVAFHRFPADYGAQLKAEGVTEKDIRWWWGMPDPMCWFLFSWEECVAGTTFLSGLAKGLEPGTAAKRMTQSIVTYRFGPAYEDQPNFVGDNKRLPFEMKDRIDRYVESRKKDPEGYKKEIESFPSVNALMRAKIRTGEL
jgi:hypothetical protein